MTDEIQILNEIETAAQLCEKIYSHQQIIDVMKTENDIEKQLCIMKLEKLDSQDEADLLVFQLTGHHGLIREAAAVKINEFLLSGKYITLFLNKYALDSFQKAINDINPNICRLICAALPLVFENSKSEKEYFLNELYKNFKQIFDELEKLKRSRLYTKKLFNLYWSLEALAVLKPSVSRELEDVLEYTSSVRDYTIREKSAMVLSVLKNTSEKTETIKDKLKNDENFYVKRYSQSF